MIAFALYDLHCPIHHKLYLSIAVWLAAFCQETEPEKTSKLNQVRNVVSKMRVQ